MKKRGRKFAQLGFPVVFIAVITATGFSLTTAAAQEKNDREGYELGTITVTAQKGNKEKQKISTNVTAFDAFTIQDLGIENVEDLTELTPNFNIDKITAHGSQMVFRGIGGITYMSPTWNINVDGVTIPYSGIDMLFDVERVELMRGGQGALYGRNTHAGVVNVITRKPTSEFSMDASVEVESYNTQKVKMALGGPIDEKNGYRLALGYTRTDGYMENEYLGTDDGLNQEQFSGRATYQYTPSADSQLTFTLTGDTYDGGFDGYAPLVDGEAPTKTFSNEAGKEEGHLISPTVTWVKQLSGMSLTSITNYSSSEFAYVYDYDLSPYDIIVQDYEETFDTITQELRLSGGENGAFKWLGGLLLMLEDYELTSDIAAGKDVPAEYGMFPGMHMLTDSEIASQGAAVFGRVETTLMDRVEVGIQLRLSYENRELTWQTRYELDGFLLDIPQDYTTEEDWFAWMPSLDLAYVLSERQRVYGSVARGYRVGDFAAGQSSLEAISKTVDPEYTLTYEVGYKGLLANKRLELNVALFYIDWSDMQVSVVKGTSFLTQNAADAHSYGFELEGRWLVTQGFDVFAAIGWFEGEFDSYDNHPSGMDLDGNKLPNANEYSFSIGTRYRHDSGFFTSMTASHMGPKYMDELNQIKQDAYTLVNAKVGYESANWAAYVYGRNLLDEEYLLHTFVNAGRSAEPVIVGTQFNYFF